MNPILDDNIASYNKPADPYLTLNFSLEPAGEKVEKILSKKIETVAR